MPYSTSNPPQLSSTGGIGGTSTREWQYRSTDAAAVVAAAGYFTDARRLGMKVGDRVYCLKTDANPPVATIHTVTAIAANGSADMTDGLAVGVANVG